ERAGVERLTVYRHFPDERAIFGACSSQWELQHPLPDPAEWSSIPDPHERLRTGLGALYDYYQDAWPMLFSVLRDAPQVPEMSEVVQDYAQRAQRIVDSLSPSPSPDDEQRAAIQMAADPFAWNALSRSGLSTDRAAALMTRMIVRGSAEESPRN
ncbi:MAG: TetR/AcrR family transcriptional regulator, partial [Thermomicrobiales bacterium]